MDEAMTQADTIVHERKDRDQLLNSAHAELAKSYGDTNICTVPLIAGQKMVGAMILEREGDQKFNSDTVKIYKEIGLLIGLEL